eukprot:CAMPEP_0113668544 /NCGR_PEP_ID=MMETSP0038_2-20120614/4063_1 /TAXON_ID=2898 /ORGANISM="Cryptomonas paramecium" /LENGTH=82 /DNA_ID=CAMNT_0000584307 /DNA_START=283 /DNA_END=531 /DNA_ORIENTATION=+ /assembly_acc=CAM_ASM_000170
MSRSEAHWASMLSKLRATQGDSCERATTQRPTSEINRAHTYQSQKELQPHHDTHQSIALRWLSRTISMARSMLLPAAGAEPQ